jgi:hypothetical protein
MRARLVFAALLFCAPHALIAQQIDTLAIRAHTRFLADDLLAGRGTGTQGERVAASYISSQLERLGLLPLACFSTATCTERSYLLPVPLRAARIDPASTVVVTGAADSATFRSGREFIVNTGGQGSFRDFSGRAVFFGQPIHAAPLVTRERNLQGRVAVFLGPLGGDAVQLVPALKAAGAAGIVLLVTDAAQFDLYVRSRGAARYFVDAPVDDPVWQPDIPVLIAGPALSATLFRGMTINDALVQGAGTAPQELGKTVSARIRATVENVPAANVGGFMRGSDAALRNELVVYTAHYDHLGISTPDANGDSIYNGFSDNAAGTAMLLAIAEAVRTRPWSRSVAFLFFTGEERGLLGSTYMASHPPVPLQAMKALINLDAGAPPAPPVTWRVATGGAPQLGQIAQQVATSNRWTAAVSGASPNSDYWPFLHRGVPAIFIIPGDQWEHTTPEQRDALRRRWDRYHQAGDHWHPEFPFSGLKRYAEFAMQVGARVANQR